MSFSLLCVTYESLDSSPQVAEPSIEDLNLDKKESEVEVSLENDERERLQKRPQNI